MLVLDQTMDIFMNREDHEKWAEIILVYLVEHIKNFQGGNKYVTYGELANNVGYPLPYTGNLFGRNIGTTLSVMGHMLDKLVIDVENVPLIQSLVVNQNKKLPSDGLKEFSSTYPCLSDQKKKDFVNLEYGKIFQFGARWEKVLIELGFVPINNVSVAPRNNITGLYNPYGSEGSPEHIALRNFIAKNPSVIGIGGRGITEYPLKSGDKVDVVFETSNSIIGVEVKSRRSGTDDIERGLFQCIKYCAVLIAESKVNKNMIDVRCILVLEDILPAELIKVKNSLGITVFENVSPK